MSADDREGLLAIAPEDIARSHKPIWLYAIRCGYVYRVDNYEQARKTIFGA
jgi:hypothetical protein